MFIEITRRFGIPGSSCITVGDSLRDLKAAEAISAKSILVLTGNGSKTLNEHKSDVNRMPNDVAVADDLHSAIEKII